MADNHVRSQLELDEVFDRDILGATNEGFCIWLSNTLHVNITPLSPDFAYHRVTYWPMYRAALKEARDVA